MTFEIRNAWGEVCGWHDTRAAAEADLIECQRIRPDLTFEIVEVED